jgi:hypothetical protein
MHLRLDPTRNNQAQGIKWARDYELQSVLGRLGSRRGADEPGTGS